MLRHTNEPALASQEGDATTEHSGAPAKQSASAAKKPKARATKRKKRKTSEKAAAVGARLCSSTDVEAPQDGFDYTQLDAALAAQARDAAQKIRKELRRSSQAAFDIGKILVKMKEALGHGRYLEWRSAEFPGSGRTATDWAKIAEVFDGKPELLRRFPPTSLATLAHLDEAIRERVLAQIESKKIVTGLEMKAAIREAAAELDTEPEGKEAAPPAQMAAAMPEVTATVGAPAEAGEIVAASEMTAAAREECAAARMQPEAKAEPAKYGAPLRDLIGIARPQLMDLIDGVEEVSLCLAKVLKHRGGEIEMGLTDVRKQIGRTLPALYLLAGTDRETEAGPGRRLAGRWQTIERTLHRLDESVAETAPEGTARVEELRRARQALAQLLI